MSLLDIAAKVLTTYQADTADMKAKIKELAGEQKKLAQAELEAAEARNKQADQWVDRLGKAGLAINTVKEVTQVAFEGLKEYGHKLDLEATAGYVSIDKLSKAAGGLRTEMELLEHAAVFNKSAFKLTQDQMEVVERAMWALEERGKSSEQVWDAVSTALTKGTTKALEALVGPIIKSADAFDVNGEALQTYGGRAKAVDAILKKLAETSAEVGEGQYDEADRVQLISVRITDAMEKMKESLGKMVVALEPLITGVAKLGEGIGNLTNKIATGWQDITDFLSVIWGVDPAEMKKRIGERHNLDLSESVTKNKQGDRYESYIAQGGSQADWIATQIAQREYERQANPPLSFNPILEVQKLWYQGGQIADSLWDMEGRSLERAKKRMEHQRELAKQFEEEIRKLVNEEAKASTDELVNRLEAETEGRLSGALAVWHSGSLGTGRGFAPAISRRPGAAGRWGDYLERDAGGVAGVSGLRFGYDSGADQGEFRNYDANAGINPQADVGPLFEQFYGDYFKTGSSKSAYGQQQAQAYGQWQKRQRATFLEDTFGKLEEFNAYKGAWETLNEAIMAGLDAVISGSGGVAEAIKKALGQAAKHEALSMAAQALKATALGIFSAATGDAPGAAAYFTSAGEFTAAALAFGVLAAATGGGSSSSAARPSAPNVAAAGGAPGGGTQAIIVIGDSFAEDTPRMRQLRAQRMVSVAVGTNAIVYG